MNKAIIVGNIGKDAEVKSFQERNLIIFSLATNEQWKDKKRTDWHKIHYWSKTDKIAQYLVAGAKVAVVGANRVDKKDDKFYHYIDAREIEIVKFASDSAPTQGNNRKPADEIDFDEVPF